MLLKLATWLSALKQPAYQPILNDWKINYEDLVSYGKRK